MLTACWFEPVHLESPPRADHQEDKKPLFDTADTLKDTPRIFVEMVGGQLNPATA